MLASASEIPSPAGSRDSLIPLSSFQDIELEATYFFPTSLKTNPINAYANLGRSIRWIGCPHYAAPEIVGPVVKIFKKSDVYMLCKLVLDFFRGKKLFDPTKTQFKSVNLDGFKQEMSRRSFDTEAIRRVQFFVLRHEQQIKEYLVRFLNKMQDQSYTARPSISVVLFFFNTLNKLYRYVVRPEPTLYEEILLKILETFAYFDDCQYEELVTYVIRCCSLMDEKTPLDHRFNDWLREAIARMRENDEKRSSNKPGFIEWKGRVLEAIRSASVTADDEPKESLLMQMQRNIDIIEYEPEILAILEPYLLMEQAAMEVSPLQYRIATALRTLIEERKKIY